MLPHYYDGLFRGNPPSDEDDEYEQASETTKSDAGETVFAIFMMLLFPLGLLAGVGFLIYKILGWLGLI